MNRPNEIGSVVKGAAGQTFVAAGSHRLPGAVVSLMPSSSNTKINVNVDNTPRTEANDKTRKGRNDDGMRMRRPRSLYVSAEKWGRTAWRESAKRTMRITLGWSRFASDHCCGKNCRSRDAPDSKKLEAKQHASRSIGSRSERRLTDVCVGTQSGIQDDDTRKYLGTSQDKM